MSKSSRSAFSGQPFNFVLLGPGNVTLDVPASGSLGVLDNVDVTTGAIIVFFARRRCIARSAFW